MTDPDTGNTEMAEYSNKPRPELLRKSTLTDTSIGKLTPIQIHFDDLQFSVPLPKEKKKSKDIEMGESSKPEYKQILKGISGTVNAGTLLAILGSSGAGKTTLLNVLAGRAAGKIEGKLLLNGHPYNEAHSLRMQSAYIMQDDIMLPNQTPAEILKFSALLRIPNSYTDEEKQERIDSLIKELNLVKCQNTQVGAPGVKRGISGGERKRVAIGSEIVNNPSLLFVDEPTSGLDSFTAESVMQTLRTLAKSGRTIICTIHQPNSDIFELFDQLMLLADGHVVYYGPANKAVDYFASIGFPCRAYVNPADFFMKLIHIDQSDPESRSRVEKLIQAYKESSMYQQQKESKPKVLPLDTTKPAHAGYAQGFLSQLKLVSQRNFVDMVREPLKLRATAGQTIFMSLILGLIYLQISNGQASRQDRLGALFFSVVNQAMSSVMSVVNIFANERAIFLREHSNNMYRTSAYYFAKLISDLPWQIFFPSLFGTIIYWLVGFQAEADRYFIFLVFLILSSNIGSSIGLILGILAKDASVAVTLTPVCILPFMIFSGFFVNTDSVPAYFVWVEYISFVKYSFRGIVRNEFEGLVFNCDDSDKILGADGILRCRIETGEQAMRDLKFEGTIGEDIAILCGMLVALRIAAYAALLWRANTQKANA